MNNECWTELKKKKISTKYYSERNSKKKDRNKRWSHDFDWTDMIVLIKETSTNTANHAYLSCNKYYIRTIQNIIFGSRYAQIRIWDCIQWKNKHWWIWSMNALKVIWIWSAMAIITVGVCTVQPVIVCNNNIESHARQHTRANTSHFTKVASSQTIYN